MYSDSRAWNEEKKPFSHAAGWRVQLTGRATGARATPGERGGAGTRRVGRIVDYTLPFDKPTGQCMPPSPDPVINDVVFSVLPCMHAIFYQPCYAHAHEFFARAPVRMYVHPHPPKHRVHVHALALTHTQQTATCCTAICTASCIAAACCADHKQHHTTHNKTLHCTLGILRLELHLLCTCLYLQGKVHNSPISSSLTHTFAEGKSTQ